MNMEPRKLYGTFKEDEEARMGWKKIIFLPHKSAWQLLIVFLVYTDFFICTQRLAYRVFNSALQFYGMAVDILYFVDFMCALLHYNMPRIRRLRNFKSRHPICLIIDFFSLIPTELIYRNAIIIKSEKWDDFLVVAYCNRCLRAYRLYLYFKSVKMRIQRLSWYVFVGYVEMASYTYMASHILSCISFAVSPIGEQNKCRRDLAYCIMEQEFNFASLIYHHYIGQQKITSTIQKRKVVIVTQLVGYIFVYGLTIPLMIFAYLKFLRPFFEFTIRYKRLKKLVSNTIKTKELKAKTFEYFKTMWTKGTGKLEPKIMMSLPLALRKNIYCDIHWEAMRHSIVLQNISINCKRALSLHMKSEFILPNTIVVPIGEVKTKMMYVAGGVLQIMAEENDNSPVVSLSAGSVLGEFNMYASNINKAILKSATFTELHVLSGTDLFRVLLDYPKDRKIVFRALRVRSSFARMTEYRKNRICRAIQYGGDGFLSDTEDAIKWLKEQGRALTELHKHHVAVNTARREGTHMPGYRPMHRIEPRLDRMSNYMELLVFSDGVEVSTDVVCLRTTCPWVMEPSSDFIELWRYIILSIVFFSCLLYPVIIAWFPQIPDWCFNITVFVTIFFILDVVIQCMTAIKTRDSLIDGFWPILRHRLQTPSFYADIIAAVPLQVVLVIKKDRNHLPSFLMGLLMAPALIKFYRIVDFFNVWTRELSSNTVLIVMLKYNFLMFLYVYWVSAIFQLTGVECLFYRCRKDDWFGQLKKMAPSSFYKFASFFFASALGLDIPVTNLYPSGYHSSIIVFVLVVVVIFFTFMWYAEVIATYISAKSYEFKFSGLMEFITTFMDNTKAGNRLKRRVLKAMKFQWYYDLGAYLLQSVSLLEEASDQLRSEITNESIYASLQQCEMFSLEDADFLKDLKQIATVLALPAESIVISFGHQTMKLYVLHRGWCQLNSFLPIDKWEGLAGRIQMKNGAMFPIIVALTQVPSAVSVITMTDCELILLPLEDTLRVMMKHGAFKDAVKALKGTNFSAISTAEINLARFSDPFKIEVPADYYEQFAKFVCLGCFLRIILMKRAINFQGSRYRHWEASRVFCIIIGLILWPMSHALLLAHLISPIYIFLTLLDVLAWVDMYIRAHVIYFNKDGILVTHTLYTAKHYLTTAFLCDFIASLPWFVVFRFISSPSEPTPFYPCLINVLTRFTAVYRICGFFNFLQELSYRAHTLKFIKYLIIFFIFINAYINLKARTESNWYRKPNGNIVFDLPRYMNKPNYIKLDTRGKYYLFRIYIMLELLLRNDYYHTVFDFYMLLQRLIFTFVGWILIILFFSFLTSRVTSTNMNFTIYQYRMKSFVSYLNSEKAEDKISNQAIEHFEHEWLKKRGEDLQKVFMRFPDILHEDITYPLYKVTISVVHCLSAANEAFYRTLARCLREVNFKKGALIIFEKEVQSDIYFVHSGQCVVLPSTKILNRGSMIGDIRKKGLMTNNIQALTHVDLLKISSQSFFLIMSDYFETERTFTSAVESVDDYVESHFVTIDKKKESKETEKANNEDVDVEKEDLWGADQSVFAVPVKKGSRSGGSFDIDEKFFICENWILHPDSKYKMCVNVLFLLVAYITGIFVPLLIALRTVTWALMITLYVMDFIWVVKIVVTLLSSFHDPSTGDLITTKRPIFWRYLTRLDGFIPDVLSVIPAELVPILQERAKEGSAVYETVQICLGFRLLRTFCLWTFVKEQNRKLSVSYYLRWIVILGYQALLINFFACVYLIIASDTKVILKGYYWEWTKKQSEALVWSYLYVVNLYTGSGLHTFNPMTVPQLSFAVVVCIVAAFEKAFFINQVLSIVNVAFHMKSEFMHELQLLETFLKARDSSPALQRQVREYGFELMRSYRAEAMPWFLTQSPPFIKVGIMQDLYMDHLSECYIFQNLSKDFLKQLAARLQREIYFPGDAITEKGDVDYNVYFVHRGEVVCLEQDAVYSSMERPVDIFRDDEYFGLMQGIWKSLPHTKTYRARTVVDLLILNYRNWADMRLAFPEETAQIFKKARSSFFTSTVDATQAE